MLRALTSHAAQFIRFGLVGGLCFALTLATFTMLHALGVHYVLAAPLGWGAGMVLGFELNRRWTFAADESGKRRQLARFVVVSAAAIAMNAGLIHFFVSVAGLQDFPAEVATVLVIAPVTFTANRLWSFR